jgi:hypothetical protein
MRRGGDLLVAIALAQLAMDKVLCKPFNDIHSEGWQSLHEGDGRVPGTEFARFEVVPPLLETPVNHDNLPGLYKQFQTLDYQYKIDVSTPGATSDLLSVLITIRWHNRGNTYDYKLTGYRAKAI